MLSQFKGWVLLELASEASKRERDEYWILNIETTKVELRSTRSRYDLGAWFQSCQAQKVAWRKCPPNWPRAKKPSTRLLTGLRSNPRALSSFNFLSLTKLESRPETPARTCHELFELWVLSFMQVPWSRHRGACSIGNQGRRSTFSSESVGFLELFFNLKTRHCNSGRHVDLTF